MDAIKISREITRSVSVIIRIGTKESQRCKRGRARVVLLQFTRRLSGRSRRRDAKLARRGVRDAARVGVQKPRRG